MDRYTVGRVSSCIDIQWGGLAHEYLVWRVSSGIYSGR